VTDPTTSDSGELLRVEIHADTIDGHRRYCVTPYYRFRGRVVSVPDDRGWATVAEAEAGADRIQEAQP
jgi:hypothetical protein